MRKICIFFLGALLMLLDSCEKEVSLYTGFNIPIHKYSNGDINTLVACNKERIYLNGSIILIEGEIVINLIDPNGIAVYEKKIIAPVEMQVDECYYAISGYWQLKYESNGGIGTIDLHLYN